MLILYHLLDFVPILPLSCYYYNFLMPINFPFPLTLLVRLQFSLLSPLLDDRPCVTEQYDKIKPVSGFKQINPMQNKQQSSVAF